MRDAAIGMIISCRHAAMPNRNHTGHQAGMGAPCCRRNRLCRHAVRESKRTCGLQATGRLTGCCLRCSKLGRHRRVPPGCRLQRLVLLHIHRLVQSIAGRLSWMHSLPIACCCTCGWGTADCSCEAHVQDGHGAQHATMQHQPGRRNVPSAAPALRPCLLKRLQA